MAKATRKKPGKSAGAKEQKLYKIKMTDVEVAILKLAFDGFAGGVDRYVKNMIAEADDANAAEKLGDEMIMDVARFEAKLEPVFKEMLLDMALRAAKESGLDLDPEEVIIAIANHEHDENCGGLN
jgi:hypothetical protein